MSGTFYKALVQVTLLFGAETWVMTPRIGRKFCSFHHRLEHFLVVIRSRMYMMVRWI